MINAAIYIWEKYSQLLYESMIIMITLIFCKVLPERAKHCYRIRLFKVMVVYSNMYLTAFTLAWIKGLMGLSSQIHTDRTLNFRSMV